jgi:hypothetical protein
VLISRSVNRFIARLLLGVMLFAQMTVAAYACTGLQSASTRSTETEVLTLVEAPLAMVADGVLGHAAMDPMQPTLCAVHCQSGQQNADGKPAPNVSPAIPVSLYPRAMAFHPADTQHASAAPDDPPTRTDPPHAILHCCFRI